jgi:hypothetical protein
MHDVTLLPPWHADDGKGIAELVLQIQTKQVIATDWK